MHQDLSYKIDSLCLTSVSSLSATLLIALHTGVSWMAEKNFFLILIEKTLRGAL